MEIKHCRPRAGYDTSVETFRSARGAKPARMGRWNLNRGPGEGGVWKPILLRGKRENGQCLGTGAASMDIYEEVSAQMSDYLSRVLYKEQVSGDRCAQKCCRKTL